MPFFDSLGSFAADAGGGGEQSRPIGLFLKEIVDERYVSWLGTSCAEDAVGLLLVPDVDALVVRGSLQQPTRVALERGSFLFGGGGAAAASVLPMLLGAQAILLLCHPKYVRQGFRSQEWVYNEAIGRRVQRKARYELAYFGGSMSLVVDIELDVARAFLVYAMTDFNGFFRSCFGAGSSFMSAAMRRLGVALREEHWPPYGKKAAAATEKSYSVPGHYAEAVLTALRETLADELDMALHPYGWDIIRKMDYHLNVR